MLRAGKSWTHTNPLYAHRLIWTPLQVKRLAFSLGGTEMPWVKIVNEMSDGGALTAYQQIIYSSKEKSTKRSTRHGNVDTPSRFKEDATHGLAHWRK